MKVHKEWWEEFFDQTALDFWKAVMTDEQTRADADFIQKMLRVAPPARLLDVPCGHGRIALELASRGYQLTGVDFSKEAIRQARAAAAGKGLAIEWQERDMRDLPGEAAFDGAICYGNSFGYFEKDGNEAFLKALGRALKPGARLVMGTAAAEVVLPAFQERTWAQVGEILFLEHNRYDHVEGKVLTEYSFVTDGKVEKRPGSQRIYTYNELCRLLGGEGFVEPVAYGSVNEEPFRLGSQCLLLVVVKKNQ